MGKPMAERCCRWCGELYTPRSGAQYFCSEECRKKRKAWTQQGQPRKKVKVAPLMPGGTPTIEQVVAWQVEYKKRTGKWLKYHEVLAKMREEGYNT